MNTTQRLIAALVFAAVGSTAFAGETQLQAGPSTATRAEVKAELARAQARGEVNFGEAFGSFKPSDIKSTRSRAEVHAEAVEAARQLRNGSTEQTVLVGE